MKPKKISKKLTLNKKTVAHLNGNELIKVKGGCIESQTSCVSDLYCCLPKTLPCETEYLPRTCNCI